MQCYTPVELDLRAWAGSSSLSTGLHAGSISSCTPGDKEPALKLGPHGTAEESPQILLQWEMTASVLALGLTPIYWMFVHAEMLHVLTKEKDQLGDMAQACNPC